MKITGRAYGKINLTLEIERKREDGYHDLNTLMQTVGIYDLMTVEKGGKKGINIKCDLPFVPTDERNIVHKAAKLFYERLGSDEIAVSVDIKKKIPVGGGMAGGSTNGGFVLRALNEMEGRPFSREELLLMGGKLGADVPFTMMGGAALASGIGDKLKEVKGLENCFIVLCKPRFSVSTKAAFGAVTQEDWSETGKSDTMRELLEKGDLKEIAAGLFNTFETPVSRLRPQILDIKRRLLETGAEGALMTGSGSTVYGLFETRNKAEKSAHALKRHLSDVFVVRPIGEKNNF